MSNTQKLREYLLTAEDLLVAKQAHRIRSCRDQTDRRRCLRDRQVGRRLPNLCMFGLLDGIRFQVDKRTGNHVYRRQQLVRTRGKLCNQISRLRSMPLIYVPYN